MSKPLRIAIAGLGTVGAGVVKILQTHANEITRRAGRAIEIVAVHARDPKKKRDIDTSKFSWTPSTIDLAYADVDVVVELIGGDEGPARQLVETALTNKKHVVTANKALLAKHGLALAQTAEQYGVSLNYEASVAGGIPIIKTLREGFAGNAVEGVYGILNGTCNYILTEMRTTGRDFADVLKEAQEKGYAEADPTFDVDGIDAAHKLTILSALAFGVKPDFKAIDITGIRRISANDIQFADELGYRIKLLGIARKRGGKIAQSLEPCLVPINSALGSVEGVYNAVFVEGDSVGHAMLEGRGAGQGPTASAVLSDLIDLARGYKLPTFGVPAKDLASPAWTGPEDIISEQYLHLVVLDQPGVIADVSAILRDFKISIETMIQRGRDPGQPVSVVITTHECSRASIRSAVAKIATLPSMASPPTILRMEKF
jgi:homoserine dehydrogenase